MGLLGFLKRIKKICSYIPVLWDDYDDDYQNMLYLMKHRLTRMEKALGQYGTENECCEQIKEVIKNIDIYINPTALDGFTYEQITEMPTEELVELNIKEEAEMAEAWNNIWTIIKDKGQNWWY